MTQRSVVTMREQVYQILREEICTGVYPPGFRLQEIELTEHLRVSRSPVREALRQLASDGLVLEIPNKGVYVKTFTAKDIEEIFDLRLMLESYGIDKVGKNLTSSNLTKLLDILAEMEKSYSEGDKQTYTRLDEQLHTAIVMCAGNSLINDIYERVRSMNQQFRVFSLTSQQRFSESMDEHRSVIHAIATGDIKKAIKANRSHLELARDTIIAIMEKNNASAEEDDSNGEE